MDVTLFELNLPGRGGDGGQGGGNSSGDGGADGSSGSSGGQQHLDVKVSEQPSKQQSSGPSWGTVAKVALATAVLTAAATLGGAWYLRRKKKKSKKQGGTQDGHAGSGTAKAPEMGSVSGGSSGSRIPFVG